MEAQEAQAITGVNIANNLIRPLMTQMPVQPSEDFYRYRIDGLDMIEEIEHQLKGEVFNPQQKKYVQKFDKWINDEGINKILHVIYSCGINKNTILGNLSQEQIMFKCRLLNRKLALLVFKKYHAYGIKKEMRDLLIITVNNTVHSALSRSEGGRESRQLSTAAQRHDIFQHNEGSKQGRIVDKLPFFGRK